MDYLKIDYSGGAWDQTDFHALIKGNSCEVKSYDFAPFSLEVTTSELDLSKLLSAIAKLENESTIDDITSITCTFEKNGKLLTKCFERRVTPYYEGRKSKKRKKNSVLTDLDFNALQTLDKYLDKIIREVNANKLLPRTSR